MMRALSQGLPACCFRIISLSGDPVSVFVSPEKSIDGDDETDLLHQQLQQAREQATQAMAALRYLAEGVHIVTRQMKQAESQQSSDET
jgi:hypothetical protein